MGRPSHAEWAAALHRLRLLRDRGVSITGEVSAVAAALGVAERSVWRRLGTPSHPRERFELTETDIAAFADFCGNTAAVHRARTAALSGRSEAAGVPIDPELVAGWAGAEAVSLRTLQRAFAEQLTPAFVAGVNGYGPQ